LSAVATARLRVIPSEVEGPRRIASGVAGTNTGFFDCGRCGGLRSE
jgi:hypothetical protein